VKTMLAAGSVLVLGALVHGGKTWLQAAPQPPALAIPAVRPSIALLNLTYVLKNYQKFEKYQAEMKNVLAPVQKRDADLRARLEEATKEAADSKTTEARREELAAVIKDLQRQIEDNAAAAKKIVQMRGEEQMKVLYLDVLDASMRYAKVHDIDLVLHYNDATSKEDFFSAPNIARKLQGGALMPLYAAEGLDISKQIVEILNRATPPTP
jgi:Skp family chaperone for outer membrane proteins